MPQARRDFPAQSRATLQGGLGTAEEAGPAAVIPYLEMLTGSEIEYDPDEAIDERIAQVARIRAALVEAD